MGKEATIFDKKDFKSCAKGLSGLLGRRLPDLMRGLTDPSEEVREPVAAEVKCYLNY